MKLPPIQWIISNMTSTQSHLNKNSFLIKLRQIVLFYFRPPKRLLSPTKWTQASRAKLNQPRVLFWSYGVLWDYLLDFTVKRKLALFFLFTWKINTKTEYHRQDQNVLAIMWERSNHFIGCRLCRTGFLLNYCTSEWKILRIERREQRPWHSENSAIKTKPIIQ